MTNVIRCNKCGVEGQFNDTAQAFSAGWQRVSGNTAGTEPSLRLWAWFCPRESSATVRQVLEAAGPGATHEGRILE